jgi:ubiquinone/menaquinone biosynthesis C-methylase UbiE
VATDLPLASPRALKIQVTDGFAATAAGYDADGREFFGQVGRWLVEAVQMPPEALVLDVGCGKGAVSIPAAQAVGPQGHVTGIDLAAPMLAHARERATAAGLTNVVFTEGDAEDPGSTPGWPPRSFDVILAGNVLQFLPRPAGAAGHWLELLHPCGVLGAAWTLGQEARWAPVIAAVDAYVPDGVPAFGSFMRRAPFSDLVSFEAMLTQAGYVDVVTVTRDITLVYNGPEQWWATYQTQGPWALSWRHIPADRLVQAKWDACALLEKMREADGTITRTLTFALTTAGRAPVGPWAAPCLGSTR